MSYGLSSFITTIAIRKDTAVAISNTVARKQLVRLRSVRKARLKLILAANASTIGVILNRHCINNIAIIQPQNDGSVKAIYPLTIRGKYQRFAR